MKSQRAQRVLVGLTVANFALVLLGVAQQLRPANAESEPPMLRGRGLEIVDSQGRVRASINVQPAGPSLGDIEPSETVILRLITERGRPHWCRGAIHVHRHHADEP